MATPLVETVGLNKFFKRPNGMLHAVEDINLKISAHSTLGVVGESGCGKSTLGRTLLRLTPATSGKVLFEGEDILQYGKAAMKRVHRDMQMIFQDPYRTLSSSPCANSTGIRCAGLSWTSACIISWSCADCRAAMPVAIRMSWTAGAGSG